MPLMPKAQCLGCQRRSALALWERSSPGTPERGGASARRRWAIEALVVPMAQCHGLGWAQCPRLPLVPQHVPLSQ